LNANEDAENSLVAYLRTLDQADHLRRSAEAAVKLTDYLVRQYREGFLPPGAADTGAFINQLFTAINFQVTQQDVAAQAVGNISLNLILVYRAMGGGWEISKKNENAACGTVDEAGVLAYPPVLLPAGSSKERRPAPWEIPTLPQPFSASEGMPKG
jgi:hypothetical protein